MLTQKELSFALSSIRLEACQDDACKMTEAAQNDVDFIAQAYGFKNCSVNLPKLLNEVVLEIHHDEGVFTFS